MKHVVFVTPYLGGSTLRFLRPIAALPGVGLSVITHEILENFPADLREKMIGHYRVQNALDAGQLAVAARFLEGKNGKIHRIFGALEDLQIQIAQVRDYLKIEGMSEAVARNFREKARMKDVFRKHGVPCAHHCLAHSSQEAWDFRHKIGFPLVIKPPAGAGARSTFRIESDEQLRDYLAVSAPSEQNPCVMEEFIQGDEHSFEGISIQGERVWHSLTHYYPNPLTVLQNPWIQWCVLLPREIDSPQYDDIRAVNAHALKALGVQTALTHMEWFRRKDGSIAVGEVAARPPGAQIIALTSLAHDKDFYQAWAELMVFNRFQIPERKYASGVAFLRGMGQGRVKAIHGIEQAQKEVGALVVEAKLPHVGQHASPSYEGEGYVIVKHPQTDVVKHALHRLISLIRVEFEA